jgi:Mn2+/Fe2+ NRAMP family transporter
MLFVANTINIGADLAAMGAAAQLVLGGWQQIYTVAFAIVSLLLQLFVPYSSYARYLKWLTLVLLSYVAVLFVIPIDWKAAASGFLWPEFPLNAASFTLIVAIIGTTISPYMFFWQSAQEVEEIRGHRTAEPLLRAPGQAGPQLRRIKIDTFFGMAVSNLVAIAIMVSTAATLHAAGKTEIGTAADAAEALRPIAGNFAFLLFSLGIVGTGLLAIPVLAGSAAYAIGETEGWKCGLENKPWKAIGFYGIITASTLAGIVIACSSLDPIQALLWSAVINGFAAVPIMAGMMYVASRRDQMGRFTIGTITRVFGWLAMAATALAAITMVIANIGLKGG